MNIIGAGLSGLLAAQYFRSHDPVVIEKQQSLPNNHHALLRFRSNAVSNLTGIRFKRVNVQKMINYKGKHFTSPNLFFNNMYSLKCTGAYRSRSLMNLDPVDRFIAPPDFISRVARGVNVVYGRDDIDSVLDQGPTISTVPVLVLASALEYKFPVDLPSRPIWTITADILADVDVYQTVYYPNPMLSLYRMSVTGDRVIAEFVAEPKNFGAKELEHFLQEDFGILASLHDVKDHFQFHGKLIQTDKKAVQDFISWASRKHNIFSLGRWGTHRQLLMDDVVQDLKVIDNLIESNQYRR